MSLCFSLSRVVCMQDRPPQHHFARAYSQQEDSLTSNYYARTTPRASFWLMLQRLFLVNTFAPQWLPKRWHHPIVGYFAALLLQVVAVFGTLSLTHIFPPFAFTGLLETLVVAVIALNFGTGPSLIATIVGLFLLNLFVLPPHENWALGETQELVENVLFLLVGVTFSVVASQVERARRGAIAERTLLDAVIETVPDSVSIYDAQGRLVRLNDAGRRMEKEQGIELPTYTSSTGKLRTVKGNLFPPEELPVKRALSGEVISTVEMVWHPENGKERYLLVSAAPLYDPWDKIGGAVAISHDMSALRQSERETSASASELEATFEAIADAVFVFNRDGLMIRTNAAFRELVGTRSGHFSHPSDARQTFFTIYDERGQNLPYDQLPQNRILRGETLKGATSIDILVHTIDERDVLLSVSGAPVYIQDGRLIGGVAIYRDITERRRLERYTHTALHALLEMAQTLVQGSDDTIEETAEDPSASVVGQRLAELTSRVLNCKRVGLVAVEPHSNRLLPIAVVGLTPEQERRWWEDIPTLHVDEYLGDSSLAPRLRKGEVVLLNATAPLINERYNVYNPRSILFAPMSLGHEFMGLLSLDYDSEEHIYTDDEKALAGAVAKLAALVIEREQLLRESAEARANEIALRDANHRMNEFLGIASHELKTPITTIKGSTQLLERRLKKMIGLEALSSEDRLRLQEEAQDLLRRTSVQVNRLTRLINDLLDVSRIQANKLEPHMELCDLTTIVRDVVQEQSRVASRRTISLDTGSLQNVPVFADIDRIEQVLTNYISNGLKYSTADKPVEVTLRVEEREARVSVRDEGPGLPEEELPHLWDRFYRAKGIEVQSGSGVGLGLGLYICKTIIELHQGQVSVQSVEGKGSTFWFSLPLAE